MNILLLNWRDTTHPKSGGAEIVTLEHAKGWVKRGHSVTWITSWYKGAAKNDTHEGVQIWRRSGSLFIYLWGFLYVLFNGHKYDVVIDEIHAIPFFTPIATKTPKIAFIHEIAGDIWKYMAPFPFNRIGAWLERLYFPLYKHTIFWTDADSTIEELVNMGIPRQQCVAIPCPIKVPEKLKKVVKEDKPTVLFVSRVVAMKGIEDVIHSFITLQSILPDAVLWIVGGGDETYLQRLKLMITHAGIQRSVKFWGKVNEEKKFELMGRAHLLLHASVKEGWGLVVLEAASQGTPAVVYNVPGLRDVVKQNKTGIVLHKNTPEQMANEVARLLSDTSRYASYQKQGQSWVKSLDWNSAVNQSVSLIERFK